MECYSFTKPGRLHLKNGEKNQDQLFGIRSRDRIAICLSDGCSTASHGLAAAQQIVTLTARMFYDQFYELLLDDPDTVRRKICAVLQPALRAFAKQQGVEPEALAAYRKFLEDLAEELKPAEIYPSDTVPSARPVLPQLNSILSAAAEPDPEKRISVAEMLKEINDLIEQLSAPRFPLAENLSSPETFIPHSRDNELKAIRKQMDSGVRPIFLYDQKNAMQRPT